MNGAGWLAASPHRYVPIQGKNVVDINDLVGDYKLINLGKDVNRTAKQSVYVSLNADGSITGEVTGKYRRADGDPKRVIIALDGIARLFRGDRAVAVERSRRRDHAGLYRRLAQRCQHLGIAHGAAQRSRSARRRRRRHRASHGRQGQFAQPANARRARHADRLADEQ